MENNPGEFIYRSPFGSHLNPEDKAQRNFSVLQRGSQSRTFNFPLFHCHVAKTESFIWHAGEASDVSV